MDDGRDILARLRAGVATRPHPVRSSGGGAQAERTADAAPPSKDAACTAKDAAGSDETDGESEGGAAAGKPSVSAPTPVQIRLFAPREEVPDGAPTGGGYRPRGAAGHRAPADAGGARRPAPDGEAGAGPTPRRRIPTPTVAHGHRERLRARFDRGEELADYELLELLLFRALPRRDTKPIARALIGTFGSFAAAVAAPAERLKEVDGVGDAVAGDFRLVRAAAERFARVPLAARTALTSTDAVVSYYRARLRTADREEFHVLYLDKKNQFLASERAQVGTVDHTPVYPREVLKRALDHGACAVVLVHNHPSGDPAPSRADVSMTRRIVEALAPLDIAVHDHLIIGGDGYVSLRGEGLL